MTKNSLLWSALLALAVLTGSCGSNAAEETSEESMEMMEASTEEADMSGPEYTSAYVCPMHCEGSGSDEAGTCPVCGMDYVANEDLQEDAHEGHNH